MNLYIHNAKDCREKFERQGLEMHPQSLWVLIEQKKDIVQQSEDFQ